MLKMDTSPDFSVEEYDEALKILAIRKACDDITIVEEMLAHVLDANAWRARWAREHPKG